MIITPHQHNIVDILWLTYCDVGCLGGCIGWALDSWSKGHWFDSRLGRYQVN